MAKKTPSRSPKVLKRYAIWCNNEGLSTESITKKAQDAEDFAGGPEKMLTCDAVWEIEIRFVRQVERTVSQKGKQVMQ